MKNNNKEHAYEEILKNEPAVKANGILAEIVPLLKDYFEGDISFYGERITYIIPNGQKIIITAEEAT